MLGGQIYDKYVAAADGYGVGAVCFQVLSWWLGQEE